jgi:hypothetical protein
MIVTCYYDIYNKPDRFVEYLSLFYDLGISGIPIVLFTDPSLVYKFRILPSTVNVIGISLDDFECYQIGMKYTKELPGNRTPEKDTKEFFSLMNTKIEFIKKASQLFNDNTFMWVDFGILKIAKNKERFINKLKQINDITFKKVTIPGCWGFGRSFSVEAINWRFCGGFFVMPREHVERFFNHSKCVLNDFCTQSMYKLTWETNVWNIIEFCAERENIDWYFADHNDSMLLNIDDVIKKYSNPIINP